MSLLAPSLLEAHGWHLRGELTPWCVFSRNVASFFCILCSLCFHFSCVSHFLYKSSATDVSAQATMKGVAKCDKHFELQSSVSQQNLERTLRSQEIPESTPASVPTAFATS